MGRHAQLVAWAGVRHGRFPERFGTRHHGRSRGENVAGALLAQGGQETAGNEDVVVDQQHSGAGGLADADVAGIAEALVAGESDQPAGHLGG